MSRVPAPIRRLRRLLPARERAPHPDLVALTAEDRRYLTSFYDDSVPLPEDAADVLRDDNPRLQRLRAEYARLDHPALEPSRWSDDAVRAFLDLRYFRGETLITWHYRELPRITALKLMLFGLYVRDRDPLGLLTRLSEDGAFGCWTVDYPGYGRFSRDLLESVNEISFLERHLRLSERARFSVLDIGAGYGRMAHRMAAAYPNLDDYCCIDAVPESTFLSEYYLLHRGCSPPTRVVALPEAESELRPESFDLALNIHSFSECTLGAVTWWVEQLKRLRVPILLLIPNEPDDLLTLEADGSRRDYGSVLESAGYSLIQREPIIADQAIRELLRLEDKFHLFSLEG